MTTRFPETGVTSWNKLQDPPIAKLNTGSPGVLEPEN